MISQRTTSSTDYWSCDRNLCYKNEYNGVSCQDCPVEIHNNEIKKHKGEYTYANSQKNFKEVFV